MADILVRMLLNSDNYDKNLKKAEKSLGNFKKRTSATSKALGSLKNMLAGGLAFAGVSAGIGDAIGKIMNFEKAISSLSALTGVVGKDLDYFRQQAVLLGSTTTQTASQVADAFKLIGSQQPQLLQSKEALVAVTRSAITLAEASESDVPTAAKALSGALNQMGAGAEYAEDYINILAAASQKGSADINYLNRAVEKSGGTANAVGIQFNELVAAIETIAPKVTEAGEAGTQLRNIFLKLEASADKNLKPSVVGLGGAIQNLADKHYSAGEMAKMFGVENVNAALALTKSKDVYLDLETAITGTNTATEQARINTDNLKGSIVQLGSAWEGLILSFSKSDGVLKNVVNQMTKLVNGVSVVVGGKSGAYNKITEETSADLINKGYELSRKYQEKGTSREDSFSKAIEEITAERESLAKNLDRDRKDLNKLQKDQSWINKAWDRTGKSVIGATPFSGYTLAAKATGLDKSIFRTQDGLTIESLQNRVKFRESELLGYDKALAALQAQAIMVPTTTTGGTGSTGGSGSAVTTDGKVAKVYAPGSIGAYQAELSKLNEELNSATTVESRQQIQAEIDTVQRLIDAIRELNTAKDITIGPNGEVVNMGADASYKAPSVADLTPAYDSSELMNDLNLDYHEMVEVTKSWRKETDKSMSSVEQWGIALQGVSGILDQTSNKWLQLAGTVLNVVNNILQETSSGGGALGSIIGGFSTIFAGAFADGGIVKGQRYNDGIVARVSSGEMIINQADQRKLFNSIKSGNTGGGGGMVRMTLRGEDLISAINNYGSRSGLGKIKFE